MKTDTDIAIAGAGGVGLLCAALAARSGFGVTLVDVQPPIAPQVAAEFDVRTIALTLASVRVLQAAGAWPLVEQARFATVRSMRVWDAGGSGAVSYEAGDIGEPALAYIVEHAVLLAALQRAVDDLPGVRSLRPARVTVLRPGPGAQQLGTTAGEVTARVVIGADGANSRLRELLALPTVGSSYEQAAVMANVRTERPHRGCARQRFLATGPVALLPMPDAHTCSVVWSTTPAQAQALLAADDGAFCAALEAATEGCLGPVLGTGPRASFPLQHRHLQHYVQQGVAFVGDAAHVVHPLAGQGLNLGIMDVAALVEVLADAEQAGRDIGARSVLRRYERWRKGENLLMEWSTDGLQRLFGAEHAALAALRNAGLSATDRLGPLKRAIMRRASGLAGDLPRVARPD